MQDPFDIMVFDKVYSIFPDGEDVYTIFKEGREYLQIQKDTEIQWLKLDPESGIPLFGLDEEVNAIGREITQHLGG